MIKKEKYLVEGMSCPGCERAIQKRLNAVEGVNSSIANHTDSSLLVEFDSSVTDLDKIKNAIKTIGYKLVGELPPAGQRTGSDEAIS